jgi:hypothetical protein
MEAAQRPAVQELGPWKLEFTRFDHCYLNLSPSIFPLVQFFGAARVRFQVPKCKLYFSR